MRGNSSAASSSVAWGALFFLPFLPWGAERGKNSYHAAKRASTGSTTTAYVSLSIMLPRGLLACTSATTLSSSAASASPASIASA